MKSRLLLPCLAILFQTSSCFALSSLPDTDALVEVSTQEWARSPGPRSVTAYIYYPGKSLANVTEKTGLMLSLHNWGGTGSRGTANPEFLANRYDVIAICVDYLQSGRHDPNSPFPYDTGFLQAIDALRSLYYVFDGLERLEKPFHRGRIYACGGSGGGNVSLMANKLAPRTFACLVNMSGMAKLSDDIAFDLPGGSRLDAGYSADPESPRFLSLDAQEIRFVGFPGHLAKMKSLGNRCKVIVSHGAKDSVCPVEDAREMVKNMEAAGLDVEAHFISENDLDGQVFRDTGHSVGDRTGIVKHLGDPYLLPDSPTSLIREGKSDFELRDRSVCYETSGGRYVVSYENGYPEILFERGK